MRSLKLVWLALAGLAIANCSSEDDPGPGTTGPIPLSTEICNDPTNLDRLGDPMAFFGTASYGELNEALVQRMLEAPTEGPFYMVNLIRYRDQAQYPDGRETDLTGREADALYAPIEYLTAIGAKPVFQGNVGDVIIGSESWDDVAIVEYPCPLAFFAMAADPGFRERVIHKEAGVESTIVMVTKLQPSQLPADFEPPESPFPATAEDPSFEMIHVVRYHEEAQYEPDANEPSRTGREAMDLYSAGAAEAAGRVGVYPTAWFDVEGVFIGDGRPFDEVRLNHMPSRAGFDSLVLDPTRQDGQHHRDAAIDYSYSLITYPQISSIPGAPTGGGTALPVASDGTGTLCNTDADCPGDGVDKCLVDTFGTGFCTREGCGAGQCAAPYVCCRACSDAVADLLPFDGSACMPGDIAPQLTSAPPSCTCD